MWDHVIYVKEKFVPRKEKIYLLLREEREEVCEYKGITNSKLQIFNNRVYEA